MNPVLGCCLIVAAAVLSWAAVEVVIATRRLMRALESGTLTGPRGPRGEAGPAGVDGCDGDPGQRGEMGPAGKDAVLPPHLMLQAAPAATAHGMARVMRLAGSNWVAGEWVRENTPAWQKAWDTPGVALQPAAGAMQLGQQ